MSYKFDVTNPSIVVMAEIGSGRARTELSLVLDTGAEVTVINPLVLTGSGIGVKGRGEQVRLVMGNGGSSVARKVVLPKLKALGKTAVNFEIASFAMPQSMQADGVLGLDFFRGHELRINFRRGEIRLT